MKTPFSFSSFFCCPLCVFSRLLLTSWLQLPACCEALPQRHFSGGLKSATLLYPPGFQQTYLTVPRGDIWRSSVYQLYRNTPNMNFHCEQASFSIPSEPGRRWGWKPAEQNSCIVWFVWAYFTYHQEGMFDAWQSWVFMLSRGRKKFSRAS